MAPTKRTFRRTIAARLLDANTCINNTLADSQLQEMLAWYGYDAASMSEAQALYERAARAVSAQAAAAGAQRRATIEMKQANKRARAEYKGLANVARAVFGRAAPELKTLELVGGAPDGDVAFVGAAYTLYDNALRIPAIAAALAKYGYGESRISHARQTLDALVQARQAQITARGVAVEATSAQKAAVTALDAWRVRFRAVARTALQHEPQLAERLGIAVRSTPTAAQRSAGARAARQAA